jgi:hypothetical protein
MHKTRVQKYNKLSYNTVYARSNFGWNQMPAGAWVHCVTTHAVDTVNLTAFETLFCAYFVIFFHWLERMCLNLENIEDIYSFVSHHLIAHAA